MVEPNESNNFECWFYRLADDLAFPTMMITYTLLSTVFVLYVVEIRKYKNSQLIIFSNTYLPCELEL